MKKLIFVSGLICLMGSINLYSQNYDYLDRNQIKALINSDGALFNHLFNFNYTPSFEVPQGMGLSTIEMANLWVAGIDDNGSLRSAGSTYFQFQEYHFGPVADNYNSEQYKNRYNRVWKVSLSEIQYHLENFENPEYELPEAFLNWPAHGNTENGESADLAPYYDYNQNGIYDPRNGDCPAIRGDQAVYFIFNEALEHYQTGGVKMGLEFHGMAYCFNPSIGSTLTETVFINYEIINRYSHDYSDFYAGMWCDFALGYFYDDAFGADSVNQMMYVFNAVNKDTLYGSPAPVQGVMLLNPQIKAAVMDFCCSTDDTVIYNYLRGLNFYGNEIHYGNTPTGYPTTYMYSGVPEDGTGWIPWSIEHQAFYYNDARGVISAGPFNLKRNESVCLDFAFPYAKDYGGTHLTAIRLLRQKAAAILRFFDDNGFNCVNEESGIYNTLVEQQKFSIFPNPTNGNAFIDLTNIAESEKKISVFTSDGKMIETIKTSSNNLELNFSEKGVYIILVETQNSALSRKLIVL